MKFAIYSQWYKVPHQPYVQMLLDELRQNEIEFDIYQPYVSQIEGQVDVGLAGRFETAEDFAAGKYDCMITLGGDGTILRAVTLVRDTNVPIAGINLGRLGFLANIDKDYIKKAIRALHSGAFSIDQRRLLHLESNPAIFGEDNFALNDCTLLKRDTSSMIIIHTYVNGEFLNSYWADGIIISTPTGSTGYSLSCGGPIIFPDSGNFVITPVAPHNLNVRPIVISDSSVISFEVEGRSENFLCTLDSRFEMVNAKHELAVRRAGFTVSLVRIGDRNFLQTIREKLLWGIDKRNY